MCSGTLENAHESLGSEINGRGLTMPTRIRINYALILICYQVLYESAKARETRRKKHIFLS